MYLATINHSHEFSGREGRPSKTADADFPLHTLYCTTSHILPRESSFVIGIHSCINTVYFLFFSTHKSVTGERRKGGPSNTDLEMTFIFFSLSSARGSSISPSSVWRPIFEISLLLSVTSIVVVGQSERDPCSRALNANQVTYVCLACPFIFSFFGPNASQLK